jgi:hypothetical protein
MRQLISLFSSLLFISLCNAQVFSPIATTGYTFDAVAENTTALSTTSGPIDGSNFVMYSVAYGALFNVSTGLPNNGVVAASSRTYQLQTYTAGNVVYLTGGMIDSVTVVNPAAYGALSLLGFSTEGTSVFNFTVRFTDNTTQTFTNQSFPDWFSSNTAVLAGFDRVNRSGTTPSNASGNPKLFNIDLVLNCTSRTKQIKRLIFQNTSSTPRMVFMALAGTAAPSFSAATSPVTCANGFNGSATITPSGGVGPYSYTVNTTPPQLTAQQNSLAAGVYTYSAADAANCIVTGTYQVTTSLTAQPALTIVASATNVCAGTNVTLSTSGANTYTWSAPSGSTSVQVINATSSFTQAVSGITGVGCFRTGSITVNVNALPVPSITGLPSNMCTNQNPVPLIGNPFGGNFSGQAINSGSFDPTISGVGSFTVQYVYTDNNGCVGIVTQAVNVASLTVPQMQLPMSICENAAPITITVTPTGGLFSGNGTSTSNATFDPSVAGAGNQTITYSLTSGACTTIAQGNIQVNPKPTVTFTLTKLFYCTNAPIVTLNGNPSNGVFSGGGVTGNFFKPSTAGAGTHTLSYVYTTVQGCSATAKNTVTVSTCEGIATLNQANVDLKTISGGFEIIVPFQAVLKVMTLNGQLMHEVQVAPSEMQSISGLAKGIYLIQLNDANGQQYALKLGVE